MTDETNNALYMAILEAQGSRGRAVFRRKRKHVGKDWKPDAPNIHGVEQNIGLWCLACRRVHPYNGRDKLGLDYDRREGKLVLLWLCPKTSNVLGDYSAKET